MNTVKQWHNVTPEMLQDEIIPLYQPAILKNAVSNWRVLEFANESKKSLYNYLKPKCVNSEIINSYNAKPGVGNRYFYSEDLNGFNFERKQETLLSLLDRLVEVSNPADHPMYAGAVEIRKYIPLFEEENVFPFLEKTPYQPRIWIGNSATVSTHFDVQDNIACLVKGQRQFTFFAPDQIHNLYIGPLDFTISGVPASMVNIDSPDYAKHPNYKTALEQAQIAVLEPGDAVYVPSLWWHNVRSQGEFCMLVNYWWDNPTYKIDSPMNTLLHGLYTIGHLPAKERLGWRELFDYFIFKDQGEPLLHLPENRRGVAGKMSPKLYQRIKHYVLNKMMSR